MSNTSERTDNAASTDPLPQPLPVIGAAAQGPDATAQLPTIALASPADDGSISDEEAFAQLKAHRADKRRRKLIKRGVVLGVCVLALAGIVVGVSMATQQDDVVESPLVTDMVTRGTYRDAVSATGSLAPAASTVVTPQVDGTIASVNVVAGQAVAEGDVLFTIDNPSLDDAVAQARIGVRTAQNGLTSAQQVLAEARSALAEAQSTPSTQSTPALATSPDNLDALLAAEAEGSAAAPDISSLKSQVSAAEIQVESARISLDQANATLEQAVKATEARTVTAPCAGTVIALNAQVGSSLADSATQGQPLAQIADMSQMKLTVQISEKDISRVEVGQAAEVTVKALDDVVLAGTVQSVASVASSSGASDMYGYSYGGTADATYAVEILVPQPDERVRSGMTASADIVLQSIDDVLLVPLSALQSDDGENYYVLVMADGSTSALGDATRTADDDASAAVSAEMRTVRVLTKSSSVAAVEGDLADGDVLLVSGYDLADVSPAASAGTGGTATFEAEADDEADEGATSLTAGA